MDEFADELRNPQILKGYSRPRPKHLAKKLLQIRRSLGTSQGEMVQRPGVQDLAKVVSSSSRTGTSFRTTDLSPLTAV